MSDSQNLAAWQRWQPQDLLDDLPENVEIITPQHDADTQAALLAELAQRRQQAEQQGRKEGELRGVEQGKQQGFEAGYREGHSAGLAAGQQQALEQQQQVAQHLNQLATAFTATLDNLNSLIPARLVQHALTAARSLLGEQLQRDNRTLLDTITRLMQNDTLFTSQIELWVSPQDRTSVEQHFTQALTTLGWALREDSEMLPGGCRLTAEQGEIDATLERRWQQLCQLSREELP